MDSGVNASGSDATQSAELRRSTADASVGTDSSSSVPFTTGESHAVVSVEGIDEKQRKEGNT